MRTLLLAFDVSNRTEIASTFQSWTDRTSTVGETDARTRHVLARPAVALIPVRRPPGSREEGLVGS